jgi:4-amino-4-deoxy-L-arabinose transferase-like glycosyltransferase
MTDVSENRRVADASAPASLPGLGLTPKSPLLTLGFVLLVLAACATAARMDIDESIWGFVGRSWAQRGIAPYVGTFENKPPGQILLFWLSHLLFGENVWFTRLVGVLALTAGTGALGHLAAKLTGRREAVLAMLLFGLSSGWQMVHGPLTDTTEAFLSVFVVLGFWVLLRGMARPEGAGARTFLIVGALLGLAFNFKQTALFSGLGAFAAFLLARRAGLGSRCNAPAALALMAGGGVLVSLLLLIPLLLGGTTVEAYLECVYFSLFKAGASADWNAQRLLRFFDAWRQGGIVLFYPMVGLAVFLGRFLRARNVALGALLAWLGLEFLAVNAAGNYYGHHFRQILAPLSLISALGLGALLDVAQGLRRSPARAFTSVVAVCVGFFLPYNSLYHTGTLFDTDPNRQTGYWLARQLRPGQTVFAAGPKAAVVRYYAFPPAPGRQFMDLFLAAERYEGEARRQFQARPPEYILVQLGYPLPSPWLEAHIQEAYRLETVRNEVQFFRLRGPAP